MGASGFVGTQLIHKLLAETDWNILATARNVDSIQIPEDVSTRFHKEAGDVSNYDSMLRLLAGVDVAYYFVHMMGHKHVDFYKAEVEAAQVFARAASDAGISRIIYMGGLGVDDAKESKHLASRHHTGRILATATCNIIEFRASMIVGRGSVAFDIISNVANAIPVIILPRSADTLTQPIAMHDAMDYLLAAATLKTASNQVVQIGGPQVLSYADIYRRYAAFVGRHAWLVRVPYIPPLLAGIFLNVFTPRLHARIGRSMVDSMACEMIVTDDSAHRLFPAIHPMSIDSAFERAHSS